MIQAKETRYAGCHFRSRLEARWAVFFDTLDIKWKYETERWKIGKTRTYLPDFLLTECSTWVEVKGSESRLDKPFLAEASLALPLLDVDHEAGPRLLILGDIPGPDKRGDAGWVGLDPTDSLARWGFGAFHKNRRPWYLDNAQTQYDEDTGLPTDASALWLTPTWDDHEESHAVQVAYAKARAARFEHGQYG